MEDGSKAVGLFNRREDEATVTAKWADLGLQGQQSVRDLWRQKDLGEFDGEFNAKVPRHGVLLVRMRTSSRFKCRAGAATAGPAGPLFLIITLTQLNTIHMVQTWPCSKEP